MGKYGTKYSERWVKLSIGELRRKIRHLKLLMKSYEDRCRTIEGVLDVSSKAINIKLVTTLKKELVDKKVAYEKCKSELDILNHKMELFSQLKYYSRRNEIEDANSIYAQIINEGRIK